MLATLTNEKIEEYRAHALTSPDGEIIDVLCEEVVRLRGVERTLRNKLQRMMLEADRVKVGG